MGSLFAGLLSASGVDVWILGTWQDALKKIESQGVRISRSGATLFQSHPLPTSSSLLDGVAFDLLLILVKTYQTVSLLHNLDRLNPRIPILSLQNGAGNRELIQAEVTNPVSAGITNLGARLVEPGMVEWTGDGGTILPECEIFRQIFDRNSPIKNITHFTDQIDEAIWRKLVINAAINPITAIYSIKNGALLGESEARQRMGEIISECHAIGVRNGYTERLDQTFDRVDEILRATAGNTSSMLSDILRGSLTEIESISGAVIAEGRRLRIPTPANLRAYHEIKTLEIKVG